MLHFATLFCWHAFTSNFCNKSTAQRNNTTFLQKEVKQREREVERGKNAIW